MSTMARNAANFKDSSVLGSSSILINSSRERSLHFLSFSVKSLLGRSIFLLAILGPSISLNNSFCALAAASFCSAINFSCSSLAFASSSACSFSSLSLS